MPRQSPRLIAITALSAILLFVGTSVASEPAKVGLEAVSFVFDITHADEKLRDALEQAAQKENPATATFMELAFRAADLHELREKLSIPIVDQVSSADLELFAAFIHSPPGRSLQRLAAASSSLPDLAANVEKLPKTQQQAIGSFMSGPAFKNIFSAVSSPTTIATARAWGEHVACEYAAAHPDQYDVTLATSLGKCPGGN
jgi:hypothetical protein